MYDQFPAYNTVVMREGGTRAGDLAIIGDESHVEQEVLRLADAGATHIIANPWGFTTAEELRRTIEFLGSLR